MEEGATVKGTKLYADVETMVRQHLYHTRHLEALRIVGQIITGSLPIHQILERILDVTVTILEMEAGEICLLDRIRGEVCVERHYGLIEEAFLERTRFAVGEGIPGLVVETGEPVVITDLAEEPRFLRRSVVTAGFKTFVAVPLRAKGEVIGSLDIAACRARSFTEADLRLLITIGAAVGMVAADACLYEELRRSIEQLTAKIEQVQCTQNQLVATARLRATDEPETGIARDCHNALRALQMLSSYNVN
ncbi:MAG: GAF domain-containing protein [Candidatus Methylomirabilis oxygeniifera]|uniref:GAF domain-containing protein n=1 Tax=Methylomirabilis oxygeniifera TaxID=671143 RepID=D5MGA0_METO1|nr:MAG: GAF domain-containing protein [Candidatus Methylomirabilis oxyfera]CBE68781.1 protein of unknown function [Candidatus Methylomirabilis oxyfera]